MRVRFRSRLVALDTKGSNGAHGGSCERIVTVRLETGNRQAEEQGDHCRGAMRLALSLASKIAQLNTQISCIRAGLHPITSVWCPMSYYRFIARDNASQAVELGGMALENDDMARGFGANVIRDLIREAPSQHAGWTLEIARGNRAVAAIPFGD